MLAVADYCSRRRCGLILNLSPDRTAHTRAVDLEGSAEVDQGTAPKSSSSHLKLVGAPAQLGELIRRTRLQKRWKQGQLAEHFEVRTQTVSAWERGQAPQRRFFAKIAEFLELPDERAVEVLLLGKDTTGRELPSSGSDAPAPRTEVQELVVEAIARQLKTGRKPSSDLAKLFLELMAWANQPAGGMPAASDHTADRDDARRD